VIAGLTGMLRGSNLKRAVKRYYRLHGRHHLPWRGTHDPYAILVSEIMLQQTQVDRVIPYFERWMKKFPTAQTLARASLLAVLKEWSGLGYNRRAKFLHEAVREIVTRHAGSVPRTYAELRKLRGVGDYTAKAIRVFAWNESETLIETNVRTVFLYHFFPRTHNVADASLIPLITTSLKGEEPRTWYAALMDYGAYLKAAHHNPSRRSLRHVVQRTFKGSMREVRGAIMKHIVAGNDINDTRNTFPDRFDEAYASLVRDGLAPKLSR
jgi:A/G-specific adenine glycosylase